MPSKNKSRRPVMICPACQADILVYFDRFGLRRGMTFKCECKEAREEASKLKNDNPRDGK